MVTFSTVPVGATGLEGWTSCCNAAVTYFDSTLCCKACYEVVEALPLAGDAGVEMDAIVMEVIRAEITPEIAIERQNALLALAEVT